MDLNQTKFFEFIQKEIDKDHISQAYFIETKNNDNVDLIIKKILKMLICPNKKQNDECSKCNICELIDSDNYPDVKIIDIDGNYIKKEQLLEVKEQFSKKSVFNGKQIYVIKDASKLNQSSANTMLKFLEEPESDVIAILLAQNRYSVLDTIISRCQILSLKDNYKIDLSDDILCLMNTLFLKNKGFLAFNEIISIIPDRKEFSIKMKQIENYLFEVVNKNMVINDNFKHLNNDKIYKIILIIEKNIEKMQYNLNYKIALDKFILEINEVIV